MTLAEQIKAAKEQLKTLESQIISRVFPDKLTVKIGEKGTLNVYGLGRFPVCLYFSQAVRLQKLLNSPEFEAFVKENAEKIATKKEE